MKARKVKDVLTDKGFIEDDHDGTGHAVYVLVVDGKRKKIHTKFSTGGHNKEIGTGLMKKIQKQLGMDTKFFREYLECKNSYEDYIQYLKDKGILKS